LCPDEVARYADALVIGEAESIWHELIDDFRHGALKAVYRSASRPSLGATTYNRAIFRGKRYVPVTLVEAGRGCHWRCEFCAVQAYFSSTQTRRPIDRILADIADARTRRRISSVRSSRSASAGSRRRASTPHTTRNSSSSSRAAAARACSSASRA